MTAEEVAGLVRSLSSLHEKGYACVVTNHDTGAELTITDSDGVIIGSCSILDAPEWLDEMDGKLVS